MPGGALALGRLNRGFGLPDTHLLAVLTEETRAGSLSRASVPRFCACLEKGSRLTFWHVAPKGLSLTS